MRPAQRGLRDDVGQGFVNAGPEESPGWVGPEGGVVVFC